VAQEGLRIGGELEQEATLWVVMDRCRLKEHRQRSSDLLPSGHFVSSLGQTAVDDVDICRIRLRRGKESAQEAEDCAACRSYRRADSGRPCNGASDCPAGGTGACSRCRMTGDGAALTCSAARTRLLCEIPAPGNILLSRLLTDGLKMSVGVQKGFVRCTSHRPEAYHHHGCTSN
jgi:hypothetical protein